jgi:DNA-binding HxlR family transcriptional regulator
MENISTNSSPCNNEMLLALKDSQEMWTSKWKILIMLYLCSVENEQIHFKKIQRDVQISAKVLTKELRELQLNRLITRAVNNSRPITVEYAVTIYGRSVLPVAKSLINWGIVHRENIKMSMKYDDNGVTK